MSIVLTNAVLIDIDPPRVTRGNLRIAGDVIDAVGPDVTPQRSDEILDCHGAVIMPGLVNGHTHLYSALATGMPPPPKAPTNFHEILQYVWWRLDQALDAESIEASARIGALDAVRCGTTTLIDHHASPNAIAGSLDCIDRGLADAGVRAVLCYETTDRHDAAGRDAGIEENRRYIAHCSSRTDGKRAGLVGAHASFTLNDDSLKQLADLASATRVGVHIHVAEDPCDEHDSIKNRGRNLITRLSAFDLLKPDSIFAHGTHLSAEAVERVNAAGLTMAHQPRSNMNNAVGYAPVASFSNVMLGTDGIGSNMFAEARAAWFASQHCGGKLSPNDVIQLLANSARRASQSLGVTLGKLEPGAAADIVITDYIPFSPIHTDNIAGHFLFGIESRHVRSVMIDGKWAMRDRVIMGVDEAAIRKGTQRISESLLRRMTSLPVR
ncbi:MAG: amidohydrolase family protein [Phycisphaerales bacterium]|nr:amidohydrolase family protein [Phycisphaerales bacterium]MCB9864133.1 amidohydrolase family protein [Phycisphaerales bacterium]